MSARAWRNGVTLGLLGWALLLLAMIGTGPVTALTYLVIALVVAAVLCWPASALLSWVADERKARAHGRVRAYLTEQEQAREYAEVERLAQASAAAIAAAQGDALGRALDAAKLYAGPPIATLPDRYQPRHATALLPTAIDGETHYPPRLVAPELATPRERQDARRARYAAALAAHEDEQRRATRNSGRHPAGQQRPAIVVPFPGPRA